MASFLFDQALTNLNNATLDLSTGTYYAHIVTAVPNSTVQTVAGLTLPTASGYTPKTLTGLVYNSQKWTFNNAIWTPLSYPIAPVGVVICKQAGASPASTDQVICYSDRSQAASAGVYGITQIFPGNGVIRFGDPNVLLLLNFQGSNGSQSIIDTSLSPKTIQVFGNTQIQNNKGIFDGSGDYLRIAKSQFDLSALSQYTIELIGRTPSTAAQLIFTTYNLGNTTNHFFFQWNLIGNDSTVYFNPSVATNTDVHLALVRSGGQYRFYQNGTQLGSAVTASNFAQGGDFFIGGSPGDPTIGTRWLNATVTGIRISNIPRYTANFTPPSNF